MAKASTAYPMSLSIDYPDRKLNRLTTFFRPFVAIPIAIVLGLIIGAAFGWKEGEWSYQYGTAGLVVLPIVLMLLFRRKYPKWWFDWNLALTRFSTRVSAYFALLRDEYPSTDEEQAVHVDMVYPDVKTQLGRGWPQIGRASYRERV